jgi:hypothetical protein
MATVMSGSGSVRRWKNALHAYAPGEAAAYTIATGAVALGGTTACVTATAGIASVACAGIFLPAAVATAGGAYVTYREAKELE